jgi:hypothetical protein
MLFCCCENFNTPMIFQTLEGSAMPQASKSDKTFGVRLKAWFRTGKPGGLLRNQVSNLIIQL